MRKHKVKFITKIMKGKHDCTPKIKLHRQPESQALEIFKKQTIKLS